MKNNTLRHIINILTNPNTDYKSIAVEVARNYPSVFLKCSGVNTKEPFLNDTERQIYKSLKQGNIVEAIKYYRAAHDNQVGLKDSKDAVEAMRDRWQRQGII